MPDEGGSDGVCMHQSRQVKVRVVQGSRGPWNSALAPQLSMGKMLLSRSEPTPLRAVLGDLAAGGKHETCASLET